MTDHTFECLMAFGTAERDTTPTIEAASGVGKTLDEAQCWIEGLETKHARIFRVTVTVHEEVYHDTSDDPRYDMKETLPTNAQTQRE